MAGKIFINYRRDDDPSAAARVRDGLAAKFGKTNLFMDVDNLLAGQRFDEELAKALALCDALIAIMGPRWMDQLKARIASSQRDFVREEIAEALKRRIIVIPVRVGREGQMLSMPAPDDLPQEIRDLVHYQKHDVAHERFNRDTQELAAAIVAIRKARQLKRAPLPWARIAAAAFGIVALAWTGAHFAGAPVPWPFSDFLDHSVVEKTKWDAEAEHAARLKAEEEAKKLRDEAEAGRKVEDGRKQAEAKAERKADEAAAAEAKRLKDEADRKSEQVRRDPALSVRPGSGQGFHDDFANGQPCPNCPEMVVAPAGSFMMGSPLSEPERSPDEIQIRVAIAKPFAAGKYAVTFDEWDACVADGGCNGYRPSDAGWGRGNRPVVNVSWDDAERYVAWLSGKTGKTYRLLSEAEREYVTRAGTSTPFWWGSSITPQQANYDGNATYNGGSTGEYRQRTVAVDSFKPNPWGFYNVHGNVWERTEDCWNDDNIGNPGDGSPRRSGDCTRHVLRGGSWSYIPRILRAAKRNSISINIRNDIDGFRVARTLTP
jgi:formylglycine-generating enzyme required for sulfatase activity